MKKLATFVLAFALGSTSLAGAQDHPHRRHHDDPARMVDHRARMLDAILDLDAYQEAEVRRILTETAAEARRLHETLPRERLHDAMRTLHERAGEQIDALLTPAQRATMDRVRAVEREIGFGGHGPGHHGGPCGASERQ